MDSIRKIAFITFVIVLFFGFTCEKDREKNVIQEKIKFPEDTELILEIDAEYNLSHGYGHMFRCPVRQVRKGEFEDDTINISVFAEFGEETLYGGYFKPFEKYSSLIVAFKGIPERPAALSGFKDSEGKFWQILVVGRINKEK